jgi:hypothetical protein
MNTRTSAYVQAIRGPVLLVTLGILFAVHQAGVLSLSRTWPLVIIVIGIMKLLERAGAPAHAWPNQPASGYPTSGAPPYGPQGGTGQPYVGSSAPPHSSGGRNT